MSGRIYYFGSIDGVCGRMGEGHFLYAPEAQLHRVRDRTLPFRAEVLDGMFAPSEQASPGTYQPQSLATLHIFHGWTVLSMWDRTGDRRGASSSTFVAEGIFDGPTMLSLAATHFPSLWARINASAAVRILSDGTHGCDTCDVQTPAKEGA